MDLYTRLQIALLVLMVVVILFELWLLRRRRKVRYAATRHTRAGDDFDEAYNAITSTEKIASILKAQGVDTGEAEAALGEARRAHARGDAAYALARANSARTALMSAKKYSASSQPIARPVRDLTREPAPGAESPLYGGESDGLPDQSPGEIPKDSAPKLPENYMQSKFMITTADDSIRAASGCGRDVSAAERALAQARASFDRAEYGKALSQALKARKLAEGFSPGPAAGEDGPAVTDVGAPVAEGVERWRAENQAAPAEAEAAALACPGCGSPVEEDDAFCRKCGGKLEFALVCPGCGADIEKDDAFCRKCGTKVA